MIPTPQYIYTAKQSSGGADATLPVTKYEPRKHLRFGFFVAGKVYICRNESGRIFASGFFKIKTTNQVHNVTVSRLKKLSKQPGYFEFEITKELAKKYLVYAYTLQTKTKSY
jgi:hypothetical protein